MIAHQIFMSTTRLIKYVAYCGRAAGVKVALDSSFRDAGCISCMGGHDVTVARTAFADKMRPNLSCLTHTHLQEGTSNLGKEIHWLEPVPLCIYQTSPVLMFGKCLFTSTRNVLSTCCT